MLVIPAEAEDILRPAIAPTTEVSPEVPVQIAASATRVTPSAPTILPAPPSPRKPAPITRGPVPKVVAKRVIIVDDADGTVLYEKNSTEQCAVASTQKMLTALCVYEDGPLNDLVYVKSTDTKVEPSKVYIKSGEKYTRAELLKALMVKSGNDAARALARDVAGSQEKFLVKMNAKAKQLGMHSSHFKNAHGLTIEGQYSTARDIAILARATTRNTTIASYMKNRGYFFYYNNKKKKWLQNGNELLKKVSYCTGMKTGTTRAAGRCLVSSGELNDRKVIVVCLGSDAKNLYKDSASLLKWALESSKKAPKAIPVE